VIIPSLLLGCCHIAKVSLGSETDPSVVHGQEKVVAVSVQEPKRVPHSLATNESAEGSSRKRRRTTTHLSDIRDGDEPKKKLSRTTEQHGRASMRQGDRVRSLENENETLKKEIESLRKENKSLKRQNLKKHVCPICEKSYNRSDGLYTHLCEGDDEHKALAQERYGTRCEICGREDFKTWVGLQRHMSSKHPDTLESADETTGLGSDGSKCLFATAYSIHNSIMPSQY